MTDSRDKKRATAASFGAATEAYLESDVHREGADLDLIENWCGEATRVLDVATGAGHAAGAVSSANRSQVVAVDASPEMVATAEAEFDGINGVVGDAERLPLSTASFDAVSCRIAAHHFPNPTEFVAEVRRVLRPGGVFVLEDNVAPEDNELGNFINRVEQLRDPTHVQSYTTSLWHEWLEATGFRVEETVHLKKRIDFERWAVAQSLPPDERDRVEDVLSDASAESADFFEIRSEYGTIKSFANLKAIVRATLIE